MRAGRNDPCPCGSGKKYKRCCLVGEEVISLQAVRDERNHEALLERLLKLAADLPPEDGMADGLLRYYGGPLPEEPTDEEYSEPLDWVLFGYRSPATGTTLAERLAREGQGLAAQEREMALAWAHGAVPGFFHVIAAGAGEVQLRRMGEDGPTCVVAEKRAGLHRGDLVAAWLLPVPSGYRFGCYQFLLPAEGSGRLEEMLTSELELLRCQRPEATIDHLYREHWPRLVDGVVYAERLGPEEVLPGAAGLPQVQGAPRTEPDWMTVAERLTRVLQGAGARAEEVAGGLRLWWDAVHALQPRIRRVEPWVGALIYLLSNRVYCSEETQAQIAALAGTTAASLGSRAREIDHSLSIYPRDPRYADLLDPFIRVGRSMELLAAATELEDDPFFPPLPQAVREEADDYVRLGAAAMERGDLPEAVRLFQAGVEAGERALGERFFKENTGHFWGLVESRPYMRARRGLAESLWAQGAHETAIGHYQALLRLNPNDNQGIRWTLAACLVELGDAERLERLLRTYPEDPSAFMGFSRALLAYWQHGPGKEANARLQEACQANPHVLPYLLGRRPRPAQPPEYIGFGDEQEAQAYAFDFLDGWAATPGALQWLASRT